MPGIIVGHLHHEDRGRSRALRSARGEAFLESLLDDTVRINEVGSLLSGSEVLVSGANSPSQGSLPFIISHSWNRLSVLISGHVAPG